MITISPRRALVALATAAALIPAAPALAQTATPTVTIGPTPSATPTPTTPPAGPALTGFEVSRPVIDFGQTVDATVRGTPGTVVELSLINPRTVTPRVIRTGTIGANGSFTWTGLRPEDTAGFSVRAASISVSTPTVTVQVRRTVSIGISQANGIYTFTGVTARAEAGVQVTIARLDDQTKRVTGVASTRTTADGRYVIRTSLPQGLAGYYALTEARNGLEAGRSRLYGLLVNTRPTAPTPTATQSVSLDVGRSSGNVYIFSGAVSPGRSVPVTLARVVNGQLIGVAGGRSATNGGYVFRVPVGVGTHFFQVITATAKSRVYGLVVPSAAVVPLPVVQPPTSSVSYANCTALRMTYPNGIGRAGAVDRTSGTPVTTWVADTNGYNRAINANDDLDRDNDGIACEQA